MAHSELGLEESMDELNSSDSDSEDEEEEEELEVEDGDVDIDPRTKFEEVISGLKSDSLKLDTQANLDDFIQQNGDILGKRSSYYGHNLLHYLADNAGLPNWHKKTRNLSRHSS